jgi:hypothetical protein
MSNETNNVSRNAGFKQVCVWPATIVVPEGANAAARVIVIQEFEKFFLDTQGWRIQYLEEIKTNPDTDLGTGRAVEGTGGRNDVLFALHDDDVDKAAVSRLAIGIRWIEDVLSPQNYSSMLYPDRVRFYQVWPLDGTIIEPTPNEAGGVPMSPVVEVAAPAVVVSETNNTTKESTMNEEVKVEVPAPAPVGPMNQMATALLAMLKPHLEAQITAIVRDTIREELFSDKLHALIEGAIDTVLDGKEFLTERDVNEMNFVTQSDLDEAVESSISHEGFVTKIAEEVQEKLDLDSMFGCEDFNRAVSSVVEEMEFSVSVESNGRFGRRR